MKFNIILLILSLTCIPATVLNANILEDGLIFNVEIFATNTEQITRASLGALTANKWNILTGNPKEITAEYQGQTVSIDIDQYPEIHLEFVDIDDDDEPDPRWLVGLRKTILQKLVSCNQL